MQLPGLIGWRRQFGESSKRPNMRSGARVLYALLSERAERSQLGPNLQRGVREAVQDFLPEDQNCAQHAQVEAASRNQQVAELLGKGAQMYSPFDLLPGPYD